MSAEDKDEADPTVIEDKNLEKQAPVNNAAAKTIEEVDEFLSMVAENFWENRPKGTEYLDIDVILVECEGTKTTTNVYEPNEPRKRTLLLRALTDPVEAIRDIT